MDSNQLILSMYVNQAKKRYIDFMCIETFPRFEILEKKISLADATQKGFGSFASHHYDIPSGKHSLIVWQNIYQPQLNAEYLLYHEFTHILDTERYVQQDKLKNVMYRGFSEYHAGQIDFLKVLGAEKIDAPFNFSVKQMVQTVSGDKSAEEFLVDTLAAATELVERSDFPADVETLAVWFGLIFNYWGRRSICEMYAADYIEAANTQAIEKCIGREPFKALDAFMNGWLTDDHIKLIGEFYFKMIASKMQEYSL